MSATDAIAEFDQVIKAWEMKSPEDRTENNIIDDVLLDWMGKEFAKEVKNHTRNKVKSLQWCQREAYMNQQFARAVQILTEDWDAVEGERKQQIQKGFLIKRKEIENIIGKDAMAGWMSNITLIDLLDGIDPGDHLKLADCFAKPYDDAAHGVDFIVAAEKGGKTTYNLIQLKTSGKGNTSIERFDEQSLGEYGVWAGSRILDPAVEHRFIQKRDEVRKNAEKEGKNVDVRCFIIEVPSYDSPVSMDSFGRVRDEAVRARFVQDSYASGLFERGEI